VAGLYLDQFPIKMNEAEGNWLSFYTERIGNPYGLENPSQTPFRGFRFKGYGPLFNP